MSKIQMNIAGGYLRTTVQETIDKNPQLSEIEATELWLRTRYGGWIESHMETTAYVIGDVTTSSFSIVFDSPNHEDYFVRNVGGRVVPMEVSE